MLVFVLQNPRRIVRSTVTQGRQGYVLHRYFLLGTSRKIHEREPSLKGQASNLVVVDEGVTAATAGVTIRVDGHKGTSSATRLVALTSQAGDSHVLVDLVVLEDSHLDLLVPVFLPLGGGVLLLFTLLTTTTKAEHQVEGRLLLDVVVGEGTAILKLLSSEDKTLLIRRVAFLILDLLLHIVNAVRRFNIEGDSFSRKGLDKNLHRHILSFKLIERPRKQCSSM